VCKVPAGSLKLGRQTKISINAFDYYHGLKLNGDDNDDDDDDDDGLLPYMMTTVMAVPSPENFAIFELKKASFGR